MNITAIIQAIYESIFQATYDANINAAKTILASHTEANNANDLREKLNYLPDEIYTQRKKINAYRTQQRELLKNIREKETALKSLENDLLLFITAETNPDTGKAKYSNDKARQAELSNRKKNDPEYIALDNHVRGMRSQADDTENQVAMVEADLERLQLIFTAITKQMNLVCQELALTTAAMSNQKHALQQFGTRFGGATMDPGCQCVAEDAPVAGQADGWDS